MNRNNFTSESVTCGHPDKICDQIADRILDALLEQDPQSRVACEVTCTTDAVHIFGEVTAKAEVDYAGLARRVIEETAPFHTVLLLKAGGRYWQFSVRTTFVTWRLPEYGNRKGALWCTTAT